jgi:hypothetical protein
MYPEPPEPSPEILSEAILYKFTSPALTPEEAGPRERHGRPTQQTDGQPEGQQEGQPEGD